MKKILALFGAVACGFAVPSLHATPYGTEPGQVVPPKSAPHVAKAAPKRAVYYITSVNATGSHLPLVVCRYNGSYYSQSPFAVYGRPDLDRTGQLTVIGELAQRDPAITVSAGHR